MEWYSIKDMEVDDERYGLKFKAGWDGASEVSVFHVLSSSLDWVLD
jgi:hypothetical protein